MKPNQKVLWLLLRLSFGWIFLYSGIHKITNPDWSAAGYLNSAHNFSGFYHWLASASMLPLTNALNEWGQLLIGISLIIGLGVRYSAIFAAVMMVMYYFVLPFPQTSAVSYIVDEHVIYALVLLLMSVVGAGKAWGLDQLVWAKKFSSN